MSPAITEDPVLVMVVPASTAKFVAVPREMGAVAAFAGVTSKTPSVATDTRLNTTASNPAHGMSPRLDGGLRCGP